MSSRIRPFWKKSVHENSLSTRCLHPEVVGYIDNWNTVKSCIYEWVEIFAVQKEQSMYKRDCLKGQGQVKVGNSAWAHQVRKASPGSIAQQLYSFAS